MSSEIPVHLLLSTERVACGVNSWRRAHSVPAYVTCQVCVRTPHMADAEAKQQSSPRGFSPTKPGHRPRKVRP